MDEKIKDEFSVTATLGHVASVEAQRNWLAISFCHLEWIGSLFFVHGEAFSRFYLQCVWFLSHVFIFHTNAIPSFMRGPFSEQIITFSKI